MNDERRVAEDALVVPLFLGGNFDKRENATCETARFTSLDEPSEISENADRFSKIWR